jgi:hypothetical protein
VKIQAEAKEPVGRSSRNQSKNMISNIATKRREEALNKDNMVDGVIFP